MSKTTLGFIFSGMVYLTIGVTLGALFFILPQLRALSLAHGHLNLVGFLTFFVFGVAYHILPRFRGRPLYSEGLGWVHLWMANIGLVGMLVMFAVGAYQPLGSLVAFQVVFGATLAVSVYLFIYNMARTLI